MWKSPCQNCHDKTATQKLKKCCPNGCAKTAVPKWLCQNCRAKTAVASPFPSGQIIHTPQSHFKSPEKDQEIDPRPLEWLAEGPLVSWASWFPTVLYLLVKLSLLKENPITFFGYFPGLFISIFSHLPASSLDPRWSIFPSEATTFPQGKLQIGFCFVGFSPITSVFMPVRLSPGHFVLPYFQSLGMVLTPRPLSCCHRSFWDLSAERCFYGRG